MTRNAAFRDAHDLRLADLVNSEPIVGQPADAQAANVDTRIESRPVQAGCDLVDEERKGTVRLVCGLRAV